MKCPFCGFEESKVIDSRSADDGNRIRRRRECLQCVKRFTTYEIIEQVPIVVVKKDGSREVFDRQKLLNGLLRACEKRQVSLAVLEKAVWEVIMESMALKPSVIPSPSWQSRLRQRSRCATSPIRNYRKNYSESF
jgi:transcriptional repressor NrdR